MIELTEMISHILVSVEDNNLKKKKEFSSTTTSDIKLAIHFVWFLLLSKSSLFIGTTRLLSKRPIQGIFIVMFYYSNYIICFQK